MAVSAVLCLSLGKASRPGTTYKKVVVSSAGHAFAGEEEIGDVNA